MKGTAIFSNFVPAFAAANGLVTQPATAKLTLPENASLHAYHELNDQWAVHGDVTWTRWTRLQELVTNFANGNQQIAQFNWDNTMRYSAGVTYKHDSRWTFRAGAAFDETPVSSAIDRSPRLPDEDRIWLVLGMTYAPNDHWSFDAGYVHLIIDDTKIRDTEANTGHTLIGEVEGDVDLLSAQVVYRF